MNMLYGREQEMRFLEQNFQKDGSTLLALYGKRRTGKTELLKQFCKDKSHAFYVCRETTDGEQIRLFSKKVLEDSPIKDYVKNFEDWETAFTFLLDEKFGKSVVIIDEFPYMVQNNTSIPSILQNVWDAKSEQSNVMIVLTGSAMTYMENEILAGNKPLFGRTAGSYILGELSYSASLSLLGQNSPWAKEAYGILGGVPRYLQQFSSQKTMEQNIKDHLLSKGCALNNEVDYLMKQDLREPSTYYTILEALASGLNRIGEISKQTGLDRTKINVYLKNLQTYKVVERQQPLAFEPQKNAHNGRYLISNNYFRFYFRFMYPHYSWLEEGEYDRLYKEMIEPNLSHFLKGSLIPAVKETILQMHGDRILPMRIHNIGAYWDKSTSFDLLAHDSMNNIMAVELVTDPSGANLNDLQNLRDRVALLRLAGVEKTYCLFSLHGFAPTLKQMSELDHSILLLNI